MATRRYGRWVIMLKQELPTYSNTSKEASGHCTIEIRNGRGRMTTFVQGLKQLQKDNVYKVCIVSAKNSGTAHSTGVTCVLMPVDEKGKGEAKWEFDPDNVGGSGIKIEDFNVVFVAVKSITSSGKELTAPLVGYMDGKVSWKNNYKAFVKERASDKEAVSPEINTSPPEALLDETPTETVSLISNKADEPLKSDESALNQAVIQEEEIAQSSINLLDETIPEKEYDGIALEADIPNTNTEAKEFESGPETALQKSEAWDVGNEQAINIAPKIGDNNENKAPATENDFYSMFEEVTPDPHKEFKEKILKHKSKINDFVNYRLTPKEECMDNHIGIQSRHKSKYTELEYMFDHNPVMNPFEEHLKNYTWIRIALTDLAALPIDVWKYGNHPFLLSGYRKYNHFILGTYFESPAAKYILGVPGTYFSSYRLKASRLGFKQFKCCENKSPVEGAYGYWLMNISNL